MSDAPTSWTILAVLDWTRGFFSKKGIDSPRLDAEILISHVLGIPRVMLYARFDQPLADAELKRIRELVQRRARREPIAYLVGSREFYSLDLEVSSHVLIPRPDTETLVDVALELVAGMEAPVIVDVGTGSGNVAIAIAANAPSARVWALDISRDALATAERNVRTHGLADRVTCLVSSLLQQLPREVTPDLVVANLPYIPTKTIAGLMEDVRDFEPRLALDGGPDGLDLVRALIATTPRSAAVALEVGDDQVETVRELLERAGFKDPQGRRDLGGLLRIAFANRRG